MIWMVHHHWLQSRAFQITMKKVPLPSLNITSGCAEAEDEIGAEAKEMKRRPREKG